MSSGRCVARWGDRSYVVECDPAWLLSLASKIAEAEGVNYLDVFRQVKASVRRSLVAELEPLLAEKP